MILTNEYKGTYPLLPGKFYEVTFSLQPDDQIIAAGQQIGLMIFSSDAEYTLLPKPGTKLTIDLDGTVLTSSFDYGGPMTETVLMGNLAIRSYMLRRENEQGRKEETPQGW